MSEFTIESSIPPPGENRRRRTKYPFADMKIGDSFAVPWSQARANALRAAVNNYRVRNQETALTTQRMGDEFRVWRIK